jgi:hypothetical protein
MEVVQLVNNPPQVEAVQLRQGTAGIFCWVATCFCFAVRHHTARRQDNCARGPTVAPSARALYDDVAAQRTVGELDTISPGEGLQHRPNGGTHGTFLHLLPSKKYRTVTALCLVPCHVVVLGDNVTSSYKVT